MDVVSNYKKNSLFFNFVRYQLMLNCWKEDPNERPTFESVTKSLENMMLEDTPYLDLETLDESKSYYCCDQLSDDDDDVKV